MRGFIYKCAQVDMYPPLSPFLTNMTRENLSGTQIFFESQIFFSRVKLAVRARGAS